MSLDAPQLRRRLGWLAHTLRRHLDADLSGVRLALVPRLGVDGVACGNLVALSADLLRASPAALLHAATHELVHVFQQRQGRVRPTAWIGGFACNLDPRLEAEAEAAAATVGRGGRLRLRAPRRARAAQPVWQPLVAVGGRPPATEADFSAPFNRLLRLIPQGPDWLSWALRAPGATQTFADEFALLTAIQLGLHGTGEVCFQSAGVRLAPALLLDLGDPDFGNLVGSLETGQLTPSAKIVLTALGIRTESDFAALAAALAALGVSAALPLASPTLAEQVNLHAQFVGPPALPDAPRAPAARFAATNSHTATDFAAAFAFYLSICPDAAASADLPAQVWTHLGPCTFPYLSCPTLDPLAPDVVVADFVAHHVRRASFVGFPSQAVALATIAAQAGLALAAPPTPEDEDRIRACLVGLAQISAPLAGGGSLQPRITRLQDGLTRWIDYAGAFGSARLQLDPSGLLTLRRFSPAAPQ